MDSPVKPENDTAFIAASASTIGIPVPDRGPGQNLAGIDPPAATFCKMTSGVRRSGDGSGTPKDSPYPTSSSHPSSSMTSTPNSSAFLSFEPAPGPATTRSVFLDTEPETFAPIRSAISLAS